MLEHSRFVGAAIKLQRFWRKKLGFINFQREISGSVNAAMCIQRQWKAFMCRKGLAQHIMCKHDHQAMAV